MAQTGVIRSTTEIQRRETSVAWIRIYTVLAIVVVWEALANSGMFYRDVLPSTIAIITAIFRELIEAAFYRDLGITFAEHIVGFVCGSLIAIAAGIALGSNPFLRRAVEPYINGIGSTPKIIFLPILFLMFGTGIESKMAKGALSAFFPVVFCTTLGMILISPVLIKVGRSFNLTWSQMVTKIYLPSMHNPVITGLRLGMAITVIGVLVAELKFASGGLGFRLSEYYETFRIAPMYAVIIIIFALAALGNVGMTRLQMRVNRHNSVDGKRGSGSASLTVRPTN